MACRLSVCLLVALACLLCPPLARSGAICDVISMRVLQDDADAFVAEFTATFGTLSARPFVLAIPGTTLVEPEILELESAPATGVVVGDFMPDSPILCEPAGTFRGQPLQDCEAQLFWRRGEGAARLRRMVVRWSLGASTSGRSASPAAPGPRLSARVVANPGGLVEAGGRLAALAAGSGGGPFARRRNWVRVEVDQGGIHRIAYADLRAQVGPAVDLIDPATFRLLSPPRALQPRNPEELPASWDPGYELAERSIHVAASGELFGPADTIHFFAAGPDDWADRHAPGAPALDFHWHPSADRLALWLTWDDPAGGEPPFPSPPRRMAVVDATPTGGEHPPWRHARQRVRLDEQRLPAYGVVRDDWVWHQGIPPGSSMEFGLDLESAVADSGLWVEARPAARREGRPSPTSARLALVLDPGARALVDSSWTLASQFSAASAPMRIHGRSGPIGTPPPTGALLRVENRPPPGTAPSLYLDALRYSFRRWLRLRDGHLQWRVPAAEAPGEFVRFELTGATGTAPGDWVWLDSSDPLQPRWVEGALASGDSLRARLYLGAGTAYHFVVASHDAVLAPAALELARPGQLREDLASGGCDAIVLAPAAFLPAAQRLASHYEGNGIPGHPGTRAAAVDLQDVYDEFGHGVKEATAIRNFLAFSFRRDPRLEFVVLVGDGSRDPRNRLGRAPGSPELDHCPTDIQTHWPHDPFVTGSQPYAADDWLVSFDTPVVNGPSSYAPADLPDLVVGRLPAGSLAEANALVDRAIRLATTPQGGRWRNRILLVADDEVAFAGGGSYREAWHTRAAECVAGTLLPAELDVQKVYLTEFPAAAGARTKPQARQAVRDAWSAGAIVVNYIGHGSPELLADETAFRIEDVPGLGNGERRPLFLAFSCDVAIFDSPFSKSLSEQLVLSRAGGAAATIAATQVTFSNPNEDLTEVFYDALYPGARIGAGSEPIGRALLLAKLRTPGATLGFTLHNARKYVLLGDPAASLPSPAGGIELSLPGEPAIVGGGWTTLQVESGGAATGAGRPYDLEVRDSADSVLYAMDEGPPGLPPGTLPYVLPGDAFLRSRGTLPAGAVLRFPAPANLRPGIHGRIRLLIEDGDSLRVGFLDPVEARRGALDGQDQEGPGIDIRFPSGPWQVAPSDELVITIEDSSGINALGSSPASSILLEVDGTGIPSDLTPLFELDANSWTRGRVRVALPSGLEPGPHELAVSAGDMQGNVARARQEFVVGGVGVIGVGRHAPVPNPFHTTTRFVLEMFAPAGTRVAYRLGIHALDGKPVRQLSGERVGGGSEILEWDGTAEDGKGVANGVYAYVLRASFSGGDGPALEETATGKVVVAR